MGHREAAARSPRARGRASAFRLRLSSLPGGRARLAPAPVFRCGATTDRGEPGRRVDRAPRPSTFPPDPLGSRAPLGGDDASGRRLGVMTTTRQSATGWVSRSSAAAATALRVARRSPPPTVGRGVRGRRLRGRPAAAGAPRRGASRRGAASWVAAASRRRRVSEGGAETRRRRDGRGRLATGGERARVRAVRRAGSNRKRRRRGPPLVRGQRAGRSLTADATALRPHLRRGRVRPGRGHRAGRALRALGGVRG
jgi:hypothetical protein